MPAGVPADLFLGVPTGAYQEVTADNCPDCRTPGSMGMAMADFDGGLPARSSLLLASARCSCASPCADGASSPARGAGDGDLDMVTVAEATFYEAVSNCNSGPCGNNVDNPNNLLCSNPDAPASWFEEDPSCFECTAHTSRGPCSLAPTTRMIPVVHLKENGAWVDHPLDFGRSRLYSEDGGTSYEHAPSKSIYSSDAWGVFKPYDNYDKPGEQWAIDFSSTQFLLEDLNGDGAAPGLDPTTSGLLLPCLALPAFLSLTQRSMDRDASPQATSICSSMSGVMPISEARMKELQE